MKVWHALNDELRASGSVLAVSGLKPESATTVRESGGELAVTDGPYAETKEILFSFYVVDVEDLDAAIALAARMPATRVRLGPDPRDPRVREGVSDELERAYRDERAAVLATITRRLDGDLALAEDVVQDAFVAAAVDWDRRGVPERPGAWLTTTAWRRALDRLRRDRVAAAHAPELVQPVDYDFELEQSSLEDDQLKLLFTCCHPALAPEARMALTLRSVAGLTVPEIARAFLSSEPAMERRLTRARNKVTDARIPFRVPPDDLLVERLAGVLRVVYLVFNEGHAATRGDLRAEAIRLARLLVRLMPDEAEAHGLLALLLVTDARSAARVSDDGLVSLAEQDRGLWDRAAIADGVAELERALRLPRPGAVHDPGRDRRAALAGGGLRGDRLGADRRALRGARAPRSLAGRRRQPGRRGGLRGRAGGGARATPRRPPARPLRPDARGALRAAAPRG